MDNTKLSARKISNTSKERMQKFREKRKYDETFDEERYKRINNLRGVEYRKRKKVQREKDIDLLNENKIKERLRKREQRAKQKDKGKENWI